MLSNDCFQVANRELIIFGLTLLLNTIVYFYLYFHNLIIKFVALVRNQ